MDWTRTGVQHPEEELLRFMAPGVRRWLEPLLPRTPGGRWLEVRLRAGRPIQMWTAAGELWAGAQGPRGAPCCSAEEFACTLQLVTRASLYAWEDDLARGFCTLPGGHRVGLAGRAVLHAGTLRAQKEFGSALFRVARDIPGVADGVLPLLLNGGRPVSALLFGPPGCGKTTLLRDLARQLSWGCGERGISGARVVVIDERSELAACDHGVPRFDLGPRTDVLDGCPKAQGVALAIRSLAPEVVICDEVGAHDDEVALAEAARSGVTVLASAHALGPEDLWSRAMLRRLVRGGAFRVALQLDSARRVVAAFRLGPGAARGGRRLLVGRRGGAA